MTAQTPDGFLCVDKPAGVSSHDMVLAVRRALREKRVGHAGTLDPFATGLLVMLVGRATRLLPYLASEPKVYDATFTFGTETDTEDHLGEVTGHGPRVSRHAILAAIAKNIGEQRQTPSAYSAKRVGGRRAYDLARKGQDVALEPVQVRIDECTVNAWHGTEDSVNACDVRVTCSGGTYVRALARDVGRAAGSAAHVSALRRVRSGVFDVLGAHTLADLRDGHVAVAPALDAVPQFPRQLLSSDDIGAIVRGIDIAATVEGATAALVNAENGVLVALAERRNDRWQPRVVMRAAAQEVAS